MKTFIKVCTLARQEVFKDFRAMPEKFENSDKVNERIYVKVNTYLESVMRSYNVKKHLYATIPD